MKKILAILILLGIFAGATFFLEKKKRSKNSKPATIPNIETNIPASPQNGNSVQTSPAPAQNSNLFQPPLDRAAQRITKKPFGIFITPQTSPVQPERFHGWHTGTDFEIFPEELDADVSVHAICDGTIAVKRFASGYGGVLVQNCRLDNQPITVIYGHLKLASIQKSTGDQLNTGETIGTLGKAYSQETDGERKHLHLGIHKGSSVNILGYVQNKSELSGWVDPCTLVCK